FFAGRIPLALFFGGRLLAEAREGDFSPAVLDALPPHAHRRLAQAGLGERLLKRLEDMLALLWREGVVVLRVPRAEPMEVALRRIVGEYVEPLERGLGRQRREELRLKLLPSAARHDGDGDAPHEIAQELAHVDAHALLALGERAVEVEYYGARDEHVRRGCRGGGF